VDPGSCRVHVRLLQSRELVTTNQTAAVPRDVYDARYDAMIEQWVDETASEDWPDDTD
jgi:hypothetical protein